MILLLKILYFHLEQIYDFGNLCPMKVNFIFHYFRFFAEQQTDHGEEAAGSHQSLPERAENTHPGRHEERRE